MTQFKKVLKKQAKKQFLQNSFLNIFDLDIKLISWHKILHLVHMF